MKTNRISKYILTAATALLLAACGGPEPTPGPIVGEVEGDDPAGPTTNTPLNVQITVDGNMSDWEALKESERWEVTVPGGAALTAAKRMWVTYNADYLYLYIEYDGSEAAGAGILDVFMDTDAAFDDKGAAATGAGNWNWANDGTELLAQGGIANYDPDIFTDTGDPVTGDWDWAEFIKAGMGVVKGSEPVDVASGNKAIEIEFSRSGLQLGDEMLIGILLEKADWSGNCGALPQMPAEGGEYVAAEKLHIDFTGRIQPGTPATPSTPDPLNVYITVDGDASEWAALKEDERWETTLPEGAHYTAAKRMMVTYNDTYAYVYLEYDGSPEANAAILSLYIDADAAFDDKGFATTGAASWLWVNDGTEFNTEGEIANYDPTVYQYTGAPLAGEWAWTDIMAPGTGAMKGSNIIDLENGNKAIEIEILRSAIPGLGDKMLIGALLMNAEWSECGAIPQKPADDANFVAAEKILVDFKGRPGSGDAPGGDTPAGPVSGTIAIDGNLSDWDVVDSSNGYVSDAPEGAYYTTAKRLKATGDENYIFLYIEYDNTGTIPNTLDIFMDSDLQFDANGAPANGLGSGNFANDGTDVLIQGSIVDEAGLPGWNFADIFLYSGAPLSGEWAWTSLGLAGSGATANSVPVDLGNGRSAFECAIMRAAIPNMGKEVEIGIVLEANWTTVGVLPTGDSAGSGAHVPAQKIHMTLL